MLEDRIGLFPRGTTPAQALDDIVESFVEEGDVVMSRAEALIFACTLADIRKQVARMELRLGIGVRSIAWVPVNDNGEAS